MKKKLNKVFLISLSLILAFLSLPQTALAAGEPQFLFPASLGDVDANGKITASDARLALRISAQIEKDVSEYMQLAADFDNDTKVKAADARKILRVSAKLDSHPFDSEEFKAALDEYISLMNGAYKDKPGFSSIFYIDILEGGGLFDFIKENDKISNEDDKPDNEDDKFDIDLIKITREEALKNKVTTAKGSDMSSFPLIGRNVGALSFDPKYIKAVSYTNKANGNKLLKITLNNELNPKALPENPSKEPEGILSRVFTLFPSDDFAGEMEIDKKDDYTLSSVIDFEYFDCTALLEYNPKTKKIISLKHNVNLSFILSLIVDGDRDDPIMSLDQDISIISEWFDLKY